MSRLIENYLGSLTSGQKNDDDEIEISPFVKSLQTGVNIPSDLDYKKEYHKYLTEKYK